MAKPQAREQESTLCPQGDTARHIQPVDAGRANNPIYPGMGPSPGLEVIYGGPTLLGVPCKWSRWKDSIHQCEGPTAVLLGQEP